MRPHPFALAVILCLGCLPAQAALQPDRLTCEYLQNPLGLDTPAPRFGWTLVSDTRNARQTAYELVVGHDSAGLRQETSLVWRTGKVADAQSLHIAYQGAALRPFTRYFWRVRVYDAAGRPSAWSRTAWFETAMLAPADWQAAWIGDGRPQFARDEDFYQPDPMPLFRKAFRSDKPVASARLYVSGLGYSEAYLNGRKIGDALLDPGWTAHRHQVLYVVHDITPMLRPGHNVLGLMLGNGWYNPLPLRLFGRYNLRDVQQTGRPCVKAQLRIAYADGTTATLGTDETWLTAPGPVVRNSVFLGEQYDARREPADWHRTGGVSAAWKPAARTQGPSGRLAVQMAPPIRATRVVRPVRITQPAPGVYIFDMGQNFAGVARLRVKGPAGRQVTLRYGEALHPDGTLNYLTTVAGHIKEIWNLKGGAGAPPTAWQEDSYTLKGKGTEVWSPRFTFHGFRYVQVSGWPGRPTLESLEGLRLNSDVPPAGTFACSNEMFTQLHEAVQWTFLSNIFSVQSDCPGREKMGYGADIVTTSEAFLYNYDMHAFYRKTVQDFANDQQPDGGITEIAPYTGIADRGYGGESGPLGWQLAFPYLQKQLYDFYGDKRVIADNYAAFERQLAFLKTKADGNQLFHWDISDHEALDPRPEAFTASAFYYHHVRLAAEFAGILGKAEDSVQYAGRAEGIRQAIVRKYLVPGTGRFDNATQAAQLFALWYGLSPERDSTFARLTDEFERHRWHLSTGIFATKMLFDVLAREGKNEMAYRIADQRDFPGWGFMLGKGATTLWESWAYPDNATTQNHPMFGSIDEWFYRSLLGINAAAPGFARIRFRPQPAGGLAWARGSYRSVRGPIGSEWKREGGRFSWRISVPANTTAEVWVPFTRRAAVAEGGQPVEQVPGLRVLREEAGCLVLETGSGEYAFSAE